MKNNIKPYSYIIVPIFLENNSIKKFWKYINNCNDNSKCSWEIGRIVADNYAQKRFYRETSCYSFLHQLYKPFVTNDKDEKLSKECCVLRYKGTDLFDIPLSFTDPFDETKKTDFALFNNQNSFDSVRLILNLVSNVGLLMIPTSALINVGEYSDFLSVLHVTSLPCISKKGESKKRNWSLNDFISDIMEDFKGLYYVFNKEYAHHLTYVSVDPETPDEVRRTLLSDITSCVHSKNNRGLTDINITSLPCQIHLAIAYQGLTIMTQIPDNPSEEQLFFYRREHTERYMLYIMCLLQRYTLLKIVNDLALIDEKNYDDRCGIYNIFEKCNKIIPKKLRTHNLLTLFKLSERKYLKKVREQSKIISITKIKNSFCNISDFPEYNKFYSMCCDSLGINALYDDVSKKMERLDAYLTQKSDENKERADWMLSLILSVLTVFSTTNDIMQLTQNIITREVPKLYYIMAVLAFIPIVLLFYTIIKTFRR